MESTEINIDDWVEAFVLKHKEESDEDFVEWLNL